MTRDRQQTEQRLIDAVHELISKEGFDQVRINRLAQQAGINKILIYRYFGGLTGLLDAYYAKYMPANTAPPFDQEYLERIALSEFLQLCSTYLLEEFRGFRANPQAQQLLKNNLLSYQPGAVSPLVVGREIQLQALLDTMSRLVHPQHGRPVLAVLVSAMTMLTFLAQDKRALFGIALGSDEGWQAIEEAVQHLFNSLSGSTPERPDVPATQSDALNV